MLYKLLALSRTKNIHGKNIRNILNAFIELFKLQRNMIHSKGSYTLIKNDPYSSLSIYEITIKANGKEFKRRMSISLLGETVRSKSSFYKVIYDHTTVIKIPPTALTDVPTFIQAINNERNIAKKISSRIPAITMGVTNALKHLEIFSHKTTSRDEEYDRVYELDYQKKFLGSVAVQKVLKIGEGFGYSMHFLGDKFLASFMDFMKKDREEMQTNILRLEEDYLSYTNVFEEKYGESNKYIRNTLNRMVASFEKFINDREYGTKILPYKKIQWFKSFLAGEKISADAKKDLPSNFVMEMNQYLQKLFRQNKRDIDTYKDIVKQYVDSRLFNMNRRNVSGLSNKLLGLLADLKQFGVAARDLKPENIYIHENILPNELCFEEYTLGLIDLETAVDYEVEKGDVIKQPLRAGTVAYATPSHFISNELAKIVFKDVPRMFQLQDWQAIISTIFKIFTEDTLFGDTRKILSEMYSIFQQARVTNNNPYSIFVNSNNKFWESASYEFYKKIDENKSRLMSGSIAFSADIREMFIVEIQNHTKLLQTSLKNHYIGASILREKYGDDLKKIYISPVDSIKTIKANLLINEPSAKMTKEKLGELVKSLNELLELKEEEDYMQIMFYSLQDLGYKMTVSELLSFMFKIVHRFMKNNEIL